MSSLDILQDRLSTTADLKLFLDFLNAFNDLKNGVFGANLVENWKEVCQKFRNSLYRLNKYVQVPITPKLHVMAVHVEEWLETHRRAMGEDSEQSVEASHGRFRQLWESYSVKDEASSAFMKNELAVGLQFNADNTNAI